MTKKKKDPNAPKNASSAFILYCKATRTEMKAANPQSSCGELMKLLSATFKTLTAEERTDYDDEAAKDKARYHTEMAEYASSKVASPESKALSSPASSPGTKALLSTPENKAPEVMADVLSSSPKSSVNKAAKTSSSKKRKSAASVNLLAAFMMKKKKQTPGTEPRPTPILSPHENETTAALVANGTGSENNYSNA